MADDAFQSSGDESMDEDQSNDAHSSGYQGSTTNDTGTKMVVFNDYGQPVDIGSEQFSTSVGNIARAHCPPAIESWKKVDSTIKDIIWNNITHDYVVPDIYRKKVLKIANVAWKNWKTTLRKKYDKFNTDAERKKNRPSGMKKEDWEDFIAFCSTAEDIKRRERGKKARSNIKRLHSSGRTGSARIAHKMKKESPNGEINRTELYIVTHTRKTGSTSTTTSEGLDRIKRLVTDDPHLGQRDLDNDAVALVCGHDKKGYVRGMGGGVSKTEIMASAPSREIARKEKQQREMLNNEIMTLKEDVATLKQMVQNNSISRSSNQSSEFHGASQGHESNLSSRACFLKNLRKKNIAYGRLNTDAPPNEEAYSIIIDEIFDENEQLYDRNEKFGDIMRGAIVNWPKPNVHFTIIN